MTYAFHRNRFFRNTLPDAHVSEHGNIRSLHLGTPTIQSSMNIHQPYELVLSYSRVIMSWLLFIEQLPSHITQIGLGGGSFARWLHKYLPHCKQIAIEINPQVIQIARNSFNIDFEGENFDIIQADGAEYIQILRGSTNVIMVDGFDGIQIIDQLTDESFFNDCRTALNEKGILITNWWRGDKRYPLFVQRLRNVFDNRVLEIPATTHGNIAVLAFNDLPQLNIEKLKKRANKLSDQYELDFFRMLFDAKANNSHNGKNFLFNP